MKVKFIVQNLRNLLRRKREVEMPKSSFKQIKQILQSLTWGDQQIVGLEQLMSNTRSSRVFCAAQFRFRCSKRILHADNLSLRW